MRISLIILPLIGSLAGASVVSAQRAVEIAPNAPNDRPINAAYLCQWRAAVKAMEPYVAKARATYPAARDRFLAGLPPKHTMFVTTRLRDDGGREEQVFIAVDSIVGASIKGRIWSQIGLVRGFRLGQTYELADTTLIDWMVARPDGSEEGNVVGTFLEAFTPPKDCRDA